MALNNSKQSNLEIKGIEERHNEIVRSDYNKNDAYSESHENAISNGDVKGKGTNNGGHQHYIPDYSKPSTLMNYSNLDTTKGGGKYDIEGRNGKGGRNFLMNISKYNSENEYGAHMIDTRANLADGQIII